MDKTILISLPVEDLQSLIVDCVNSCLKHQPRQVNPSQPQELYFFAPDAAEFLGIALPTLYSKVSRGELPYMKRGKRLHFSRAELMDYLKGGRRLTNEEIEAEAHTYLKKREGKNG